jgi:hypothetical protein
MSDQVSCCKVQGLFPQGMAGRGHKCRPVVMTAARCPSLPFGPHFKVFILRLAERSNDTCLGCSIAIVIRGDLTVVFKFREPSASPLQRHFPTVLNITAQERGTPAVPVKLSIPMEFSIGGYRLCHITKTKYRV